MATIHARVVGTDAVLPREDLERLVALAEQSEPVVLQTSDSELSGSEMAHLAMAGGAFDFWHEDGEAIYSLADGDAL